VIELSFCIPTFNRVDKVSNLVRSILSYNDPEIEVVVLDNGSTDDTLNTLHKIIDDRLSVYSNGENKGALFNMVNVLSKAKGKFIVYSTDQDYIDPLCINDFKMELLNNDDISCGYCVISPKHKYNNIVYPKGIDAVMNMGYLGRHPSGHFFNKEMIDTTDYLDRFSNYDFVTLFPFEFIFAELSLLGNVMVYNQELVSVERNFSEVANTKSSTTRGTSSDAFFNPKQRLKMTINYTEHIKSLSLTNDEKKKLSGEVFLRGLDAATYEYRAIMKNQLICDHYYMDVKNIGRIALLKTTWSFYKGFFHSQSTMDIQDKVFFISYLQLLILNKKLSKILRKLSRIGDKF